MPKKTQNGDSKVAPKALPKGSEGAPAPKRPVGRPSSYRPEYCDQVLVWGKEGKSITGMAARLDVDKSTLLKWREVHPEFSTALARALVYAQDWWEEAGQAGVKSRDFNATLYNKIVASRFRDDYAERKEVTGANGGAIKVETKVIDVEALEDEQLEALDEALKNMINK
jgi:hypothetical protein